jgi:hypothetical protein
MKGTTRVWQSLPDGFADAEWPRPDIVARLSDTGKMIGEERIFLGGCTAD